MGGVSICLSECHKRSVDCLPYLLLDIFFDVFDVHVNILQIFRAVIQFAYNIGN
jgi:hypothetical protein